MRLKASAEDVWISVGVEAGVMVGDTVGSLLSLHPLAKRPVPAATASLSTSRLQSPVMLGLFLQSFFVFIDGSFFDTFNFF